MATFDTKVKRMRHLPGSAAKRGQRTAGGRELELVSFGGCQVAPEAFDLITR